MSIKLYGMTYSNYYNIVKAIMLEKGIGFEEIDVRPSQEPDYLGRSPMGKVPCIETGEGFLTEASVIIDYLEDLEQGQSFYPVGAFERAKVRELMRYLELYIELPARRLYGDVFFGRPASAELKAEVRESLQKGFAALQRIAVFDPYLAGGEISYADFYYRFTVGLATIVCRKALDWDAYSEIPNLRALLDLMDERPSIKQVLADQAKAA